MPNPPDTTQWSEFDWEQYLRESDRYAAQFFELLKRFSDLPGGRALINQKLGREFKGKLLNCGFDCENCESRLECEFSSWDDSGPEDAAPLDYPPEDEDWEDGDGEPPPDGPPEPGDSLFYETDPAFVMLRQTALGWCNIYAAILPADARPSGLRVLFHIGRSLANLAYSIGDGMYEQPAASVSLGKRSLGQLNAAIGHIAKLAQDKPKLAKILEAMKTHLLRCQEAIGDHLQRCRERLRQGGAKGEK